MKIKSRKKITEIMLENRAEGLNTKITEAEPENKEF